jgi:hypothetical protein
MKKPIATAALLLMVPALASAQSKDHPSRGQGYFFFGLGNTDCCASRVVKHVGFGGEGFLGEGLGVGAEVGYAHWGGSGLDAWIASGDFSYHFRPSAPRGGVDPFVLAGGTMFAPTAKGNGRGLPGGNFGGGVNIWLTERAALRLEVRDHVNAGRWGPPAPADHYISFRVGVTFR